MPRRSFFRLLAAATPAGDHVPDADLLRRFARDRDAAAFELLVRRHADAVWAACRRVLRSEADADDAFQAAFLVLARKAGTVRGACAGGWLYRVAVNAALKLRAEARRAPTGRAPGVSPGIESEETPDLTVGARLEADELAAVVHEELARLPDRYRLPVVLCDLEGHTRAQAAAVLGWPAGTVAGRLSRAHALLRDRLARRGVTAPAVLISAAAVPPSLVRDTAAAAAGVVPVPPSVLILVHGVLSAMRTAKLKLAAAVLASAGLLGLAGVGTFTALGQPPAVVPKPDLPRRVAAPVPPEKPIEGNWLGEKNGGPLPTAFPEIKHPDPREDITKACPRLLGENALKIEATDDTYRRLLKARLRAGAQEFIIFWTRIQIGSYQSLEFPAYVGLLNDMRTVAQELWANDRKALIPALEELVALAKGAERFANARVAAGVDPPYQLHAARRHRLAAEAALWKATHPKPAGK